MSDLIPQASERKTQIRILWWALPGVLALLALLFLASYFLLGAIQKCVLPQSSHGVNDIWLARPVSAFHFAAGAALSVVLLPILLLGAKKKRWFFVKSSEAKVVTVSINRARRFWIYLACVVGLAVYGSGLTFYLFSWDRIGPQGIEQHLPWGIKVCPFDQVKSLEQIPVGFRSEALVQSGPWDNITFTNGRRLELSLDNEGLSIGELHAIEAFISDRTGMSWSCGAMRTLKCLNKGGG